MPEITYRESSRIKITDAPIQIPGVCIICGASRSDDRQYMDFGMNIDFYGVVYFCTFCFTEAANHLGCLTKEQSDKLELELDGAKKQILNFTAKERALDDAINYLRDSGLFDHFSGSSASNISDDGSQKFARDATEYFRLIESSEQDASKSGNSTKQSSSKQRSDDVSSSREFNI